MPYDFNKDPMARKSRGPTDPSREIVAITPSNSNELAKYVRSLRVGGGGTIIVLPIEAVSDTDTVTITNVADGETLPIGVRRVHATGTTCSNIVGFV